MADNVIRPAKQTWYRVSFYVDIILFLIVIVFTYLLIMDCMYYGEHKGDAWLFVARDIAFIAVAQAFIFVQLFKYLSIISRRFL